MDRTRRGWGRRGATALAALALTLTLALGAGGAVEAAYTEPVEANPCAESLAMIGVLEGYMKRNGIDPQGEDPIAGAYRTELTWFNTYCV